MNRLSKMVRLYLDVNQVPRVDAAHQIGISDSALSRFLRGKSLSQANLALLVIWLINEADHDK